LRYALARVLGVDSAFESVASALDLVLRERDWVTGSDLRMHAAGEEVSERLSPFQFSRMQTHLELPLDEVDASDRFSHRVL
jgi:hypothetical protein